MDTAIPASDREGHQILALQSKTVQYHDLTARPVNQFISSCWFRGADSAARQRAYEIEAQIRTARFGGHQHAPEPVDDPAARRIVEHNRT
jgi:hypothetical protein